MQINIVGILCFFVLLLVSCTKRDYHWAFAQNMDGTIMANEYCRESLAETIYDSNSNDKITRQASTNVFIFRGQIESYRIYAFKTQVECENALTGMVIRQKK